MRCLSCGQENPAEARFCGNCGASLVAEIEPPSPAAAPHRFAMRGRWLLIGALAVLVMIVIGYGVTSIFRAPPQPPPPPRPIPALPPPPSPAPPPPEVNIPPITKGEVLFLEDFESGSRNWDLAEGWHLEEIGDNTVLRGRGHKWAVLQDRVWDNYAFETRFKLIEGNIHINYRTTSAGNNRYLVGVSRGGIYLEKETDGKHYQITQAPLKLDEGWHEIEIVGYGNAINVYLDDSLLIFGKDDNPLLSGGIAFLTLKDSEFLIDDVKITETTGPTATTPKPTPAEPKITIFLDGNLEEAVREALGKPPAEEITAAELVRLAELEANESGIANLSGFEHCTNLIELRLARNEIRDISPLAYLTNLTELSLEENEISDISPLASLTKLTRLFLGNNEIRDVSPLASLTNLTGLVLNYNEVRDISPLASLTNLTGLDLVNNEIRDISSLAFLTKLTDISLVNNEISDISPLVENTGLGEGDEVELKGNKLDLSEGSEDLKNIRALEDRGVRVQY